MYILVTGGAGYIGSHTLFYLIEAGYKPVVLDSLEASSLYNLSQVESYTGVRIPFIKGNVSDKNLVRDVFKSYEFYAVIHFAGFKFVGESSVLPMKYFLNNTVGSMNLLCVMEEFDVKNIIFSSSCTVYGIPDTIPVTESCEIGGTNSPYGTSKYLVERFLYDLSRSSESWRIVVLRYFNPVGAHPSGIIGEETSSVPNNLMPYINLVAAGKKERLYIFGGDYNTKDGTAVRDYIHVSDIAFGHVKALEYIDCCTGMAVFNLGSGVGFSVLDMVSIFEKVNSVSVPYEIVGRRAGDVPALFADIKLANSELNWYPKYTLEDMLKHAWKWHSKQINLIG